MGRNMFGPVRGPWVDVGGLRLARLVGGRPAVHAPVFVLTHHARQSVVMEGGTTFHFVTDGIESALAQAVAAADGDTVTIAGGASAVRQGLEAGVVDEVMVSHSPVVLGERRVAVRRADAASAPR